jgi:hypothetical protein
MWIPIARLVHIGGVVKRCSRVRLQIAYMKVAPGKGQEYLWMWVDGTAEAGVA